MSSIAVGFEGDSLLTLFLEFGARIHCEKGTLKTKLLWVSDYTEWSKFRSTGECELPGTVVSGTFICGKEKSKCFTVGTGLEVLREWQ